MKIEEYELSGEDPELFWNAVKDCTPEWFDLNRCILFLKWAKKFHMIEFVRPADAEYPHDRWWLIFYTDGRSTKVDFDISPKTDLIINAYHTLGPSVSKIKSREDFDRIIQ